MRGEKQQSDFPRYIIAMLLRTVSLVGMSLWPPKQNAAQQFRLMLEVKDKERENSRTR